MAEFGEKFSLYKQPLLLNFPLRTKYHWSECEVFVSEYLPDHGGGGGGGGNTGSKVIPEF